MAGIVFPKRNRKRPNKTRLQASHHLCQQNVVVSGTKKLDKAKSDTRYKIKKLEDEITLLTSYATDTVYRLNYNTMRYDYISPAVERLLGFTPKEIKRVNFRSLILETRLVTDDMSRVHSYDDLEAKRRAGHTGKWQADYRMRRKDGKEIWVSDVSSPWFDNHGKVIGSVGSLRDITDRVNNDHAIQEELEKIADTDALTGLANRRVFFYELDRELKRIHRTDEEVAVLLIDIDRFRKVNDTYGRDVGDMVLASVAHVLQACLRETDILARLGGEEFGALLPDTPLEGATFAAERLRTSIMSHEFSVGSDHAPIGLSISIGVAGAMPGEKKDSSDLYKIADTQLYIAKNTGRNQISIDEMLRTH